MGVDQNKKTPIITKFIYQNHKLGKALQYEKLKSIITKWNSDSAIDKVFDDSTIRQGTRRVMIRQSRPIRRFNDLTRY